MLQLKRPAAHCVRIPAGEAQGFTPLCPPRACCHIRLQKGRLSSDNGRASCPCGEGRDGRDEPMSQLHTCMEGEGDRGDVRFPLAGSWDFGWGPPG